MSATTRDAMGTADRTRAQRARLRSLVRGRTGDPAWVRPALLSLLGATALLYLVDLAASGWANAFYSAAVQAGTKSWKAFFFGSFDSSNFITVDKPPASLWVMDISARIFGVNSWSILVPAGARRASPRSALLYAAVAAAFSAPAAGLLAGAVLALTPVAALMFRFNNPDALLTLLLVAAAYALTRALEHAGWRWLVLAGRADRLRLPGQDAAGVPRRARLRARLPRRGAHHDLAARLAPPGRRRRDARRGRLVGRDRRALARLEPAVHRRLAGQQHPQPDLRLQRLRPAHRQRDRQRRRRRPRRWREQVGPDRHHEAVRHGDGDADLVAAPRRPAVLRPDAVGHAPGRAQRRSACRRADLGLVARRHRPRLQLREGHHPPLLHRRARAGDRRARRDRRGLGLAAPRLRARAAVARGGARDDGRVGLVPAGSHADLAAVAARDRPRRRTRRGRNRGARARAVARQSPGRPRRPGIRDRSGPGGAVGLRGPDRLVRSRRRATVGRAGRIGRAAGRPGGGRGGFPGGWRGRVRAGGLPGRGFGGTGGRQSAGSARASGRGPAAAAAASAACSTPPRRARRSSRR